MRTDRPAVQDMMKPREQRSEYLEHMRREFFQNPRYRGTVVTLFWRGRTHKITVPQHRDW
jgi:hypothetical protein